MRGVEIYDGIATTGGLNFDLAEILSALGDSVRASSWRVQQIHYVSRDEEDIPLLHPGSTELTPASTSELLAATGRLLQTIEGEFEATRPGEANSWLVVRAIDSSLWTVHSSDPSALTAIRARFADVRDAAEVPQN